MVGSYDFDTCSVSSLNDLLNDLVACEDLYVDHVYKTCLSCLDVDVCIYLILDSLLAAFLGSTECHEDRHVAEDLAEILQYVCELVEFKYVFKPVDSPLYYVSRKLGDSASFFEDSFFGNSYDWNADLRHSFADNCVSNFYSLHY